MGHLSDALSAVVLIFVDEDSGNITTHGGEISFETLFKK
jgi:hypothetical protein